MEVISVANEDSLSDLVKDEVTMIFGVGQLFAYKYSNFFVKNEVVEVPTGVIQFPCFSDEAFYVYVTEYDYN